MSRLTCQGQGPIDEHSHFAIWPHACRDNELGLGVSGVAVIKPGRLGSWAQWGEEGAAAWPWTKETKTLGGDPGRTEWMGEAGGEALTTDHTRVPRQSRSQVDVSPSPAGQALEEDGGPVLPECSMDERQGQGLWGL